jgi:putative ABC transport system ATP-binding protein
MPPLIQIRDVGKIYRMGTVEVPALAGVSLTIERGGFVAIMGPSGSGKSTFMNIVGCLDRPTSGSYLLEGTETAKLSRDELAEIRNRKLGFVFQQFNLLRRTSAVENVELPLLYSTVPRREHRRRALAALEAVGLADRADHQPSQLSGGQQQRVAIARALINEPAIILADEPTGALDSRTGLEIMATFQGLNRDRAMTVIIVTHEPDIARFSGRNVHFMDGRITGDEWIDAPTDARRALAGANAPAAGSVAS